IAECETDLVEALQQAFLAERIDVKAVFPPVGAPHGLSFQINEEFGAGRGMKLDADLRHTLIGEADRQGAILKAVIKEDVTEARRDKRPDAIVDKARNRCLAR